MEVEMARVREMASDERTMGATSFETRGSNMQGMNHEY